ncbi:MAG: CvpA family protein [Bernardetiaceae bacterium]
MQDLLFILLDAGTQVSLPDVKFRLLDVVFLGFLIMAAYRGFQKGFLVELISSLALIIALFLTLWLIKLGFADALQTTNVPKAGPFITFIVIYVILVFLIIGLGQILKKVLAFTFFDALDNFIGMLLGVFKYLVGLSFLLAMMTYVGFIDPSSPTDKMSETIFYDNLMVLHSYVMDIARVLMPQFIPELEQGIQNLLKG